MLREPLLSLCPWLLLRLGSGIPLEVGARGRRPQLTPLWADLCILTRSCVPSQVSQVSFQVDALIILTKM